MRKPIKKIEIEGDDEAHTIMQVAQRLPPQYQRRDVNETLSSTLQDCPKTRKSTDSSG